MDNKILHKFLKINAPSNILLFTDEEEIPQVFLDLNRKINNSLTIIDENLEEEDYSDLTLVEDLDDVDYQEETFDIIIIKKSNITLRSQLYRISNFIQENTLIIFYYDENVDIRETVTEFSDNFDKYHVEIMDTLNNIGLMYGEGYDQRDALISFFNSITNERIESINRRYEFLNNNIEKIRDETDSNENLNVQMFNWNVLGSINNYDDNGFLSGWVMSNKPNNIPKVKLVLDGKEHNIVVDVKKEGKLPDPKNAFIFNIPNQYRDGKVHYATLKEENSNRIIAQTNVLISKRSSNNIKHINYNSNNILQAIYESQYQQNVHRSFKDRLISKFYPISLLAHTKSLGGIKNTLSTIRACRLLKKHYYLFDVGFYIYQKPELLYEGDDIYLHYIYNGAEEGLNPTREFNTKRYLMLNPDLKHQTLNPYVQYLLYGKNENRQIEEDLEEKEYEEKGIRGAFQSTFLDTVIDGWAAEMGNNNPLDVIITIDNEEFEVTADIYRPDLKQKGINNGYHGFKLVLPNKFVDGKPHTLRLLTQDNEVITTTRYTWEKPDYENDFQRFLAYSMTAPNITLPLNESEKKILAVMDNIANYLCALVPEEEPLVSIIMPVYNRVNIIPTAIYSVLQQTYKNFELIIIDDGSTDDTVNQIKFFDDDRIKVLQNKEQKGVSYSRNKGLAHSKGKYIMYLDSDNDWDERYIQATVGAFTKLDDADAVYSGQLIYSGNRNNLESIRFAALNKSLLQNKNYVDLNAYAHTRKMYEEYGGFDESLRRYVDWDLILNYASKAKTYSVPIILSNYYYQITGNAISDNHNLASVLDDVIAKNEERIKDHKENLELTRGVSIIIPSYNSLEDLTECVDSILDLNNNLIEIVIVDNNSEENVKEYLAELEKDNKIKLILNNRNFGFTYAVNQGIEMANPENDIVLLNNDAILTENSIEYLQEAAYKLEKCGMVVPQQILPPRTPTINVHVPYATELYDIDVNISSHHKNVINSPIFHDGEYTELNFAPFFCVYIKRSVYDESIGLDAQLGRHYRSDMIYCNYVREVMGYKIYHVSKSRIYHKLQKSTTHLEENSIEEHDLLFKQNRWSEWEQKEYGFKQAKWDMDGVKSIDESITVTNYSLDQMENILEALTNKVTIIIPVYNAFEETKACIESVIDNTRNNYELLLINDCSPDERIKPYLDEMEEKYPQIRVIHSPENNGFVATVNIGFENTKTDVILLNSDTKVTQNWLQKMIMSAYSDVDVATVTPVSNNAGAFSVPERSQNNILPPNLSLAHVARIVENNSKRKNIDAPTANGFCMYIKRKVLDDIGLFDEETFGRGYGEENDFSLRASQKGWKNVIDDSTYIYHKGSSSFKEEAIKLGEKNMKILCEKYPSYEDDVVKFLGSKELTHTRRRLKGLLSNKLNTFKPYKKILYVVHEGVGGSLYLTQDLISKIGNNYDCYILYSSGSRLVLKHNNMGVLENVAFWDLKSDWHVDYFDVPAYKIAYFNILSSLNVDLVHIQHLIKHSHDIIKLIKDMDIPMVLSLHDYYYICPSTNLINEDYEFCDAKCNENKEQCFCPLPALNNAPLFKTMKAEWQEENKKIMDAVYKIIAPSKYVKELYSREYPSIKEKIEVIPHGQNLKKPESKLTREEVFEDKIRILIPGNIGISKGSLLFKEIKEYDVNSLIEFHFLGQTDNNITENEGKIHGSYTRDKFEDMVREISPDIVGLFSITPETFSYTLNEAWNMEIPVIATNMGALRERIEDSKTGWLVEPDSKKIYDKIMEIYNNKSEYNQVLENTKKINIKSLEEMSEEYDKLYKELI